MASFDHFLAGLALACCTTSSFEYSDIAQRVPSSRFGIMKLCINRCMSWHSHACRVMAFFVHMIIYNFTSSLKSQLFHRHLTKSYGKLACAHGREDKAQMP